MTLTINPQKVAKAFLSVVAVLTVINCILLFFYFYLDDDYLFGLIDYFDFDIEGNVPTLYSAFAVLVCSALLALIARIHWDQPGGNRYHWLGLSFIFLFLAMDEGTAIHEMIGSYLEDYMEATGSFYFLWVLPYGIATLVLGLAFLRFVWNLPPDTRRRFVIAGTVFLGGALGVEIFGAREAEAYGVETITYCVLYTIEEVMEMVGIIIFMYALLSYLADEVDDLA